MQKRLQESLSDRDQMLLEMSKDSFVPEQILFIEDADSLTGYDFSSKAQGTVTILNYDNNIIELTVESDSDAFLFLSELYYPGWKVYIDGKLGKIYRANYLFRATPVKSGAHQIKFLDLMMALLN